MSAVAVFLQCRPCALPGDRRGSQLGDLHVPGKRQPTKTTHYLNQQLSLVAAGFLREFCDELMQLAQET